MLFNSFEFMVFFPVVTILYFLLPHNLRWFLLLLASCVFYMAFIPVYIFVLFITILIDYFAGIWMGKSDQKMRKPILIISICSTCLVLFIFKYFNFLNANLAYIAKFFHWNYSLGFLQLILPIGLSFHTFQSLSYVIEVYRGRQKPEYNFGIYALYVMFYPQLVAGPIERPGNLLHQFYEKHYFDYQRVANGLKLMLWGLFKKVVIADRLALLVNPVYASPRDYAGISLVVATVFFAFQIYCDFSGYSDIAIGAAQVMGFRLMDNFNRPYFSKSISEFWKRWHISLSSWFRDYLYIPLGGKKVGASRHYFNILFTFLISGLWHGANWTFVVWGALNGLYVALEKLTFNARKNMIKSTGLNKYPGLYRFIQVFTTFALVCLGWVFFRAVNIADAFYIIVHMFTGLGDFLNNLFSNLFAPDNYYNILSPVLLGQSVRDFLIVVASILFMEYLHLIQRHGSIRSMLSQKPAWMRWSIYSCMVFSIIIFGVYGNDNSPFIYFQF